MKQGCSGRVQENGLEILHYDVWQDEDGYHARYTGPLPKNSARCRREVHAEDFPDLLHKAVRNRIRAWAWVSAPEEPRFTTGDIR